MFQSLPDSLGDAPGIIKPRTPARAVRAWQTTTGCVEQALSRNCAILAYGKKESGVCGKHIVVSRWWSHYLHRSTLEEFDIDVAVAAEQATVFALESFKAAPSQQAEEGKGRDLIE